MPWSVRCWLQPRWVGQRRSTAQYLPFILFIHRLFVQPVTPRNNRVVTCAKPEVGKRFCYLKDCYAAADRSEMLDVDLQRQELVSSSKVLSRALVPFSQFGCLCTTEDANAVDCRVSPVGMTGRQRKRETASEADGTEEFVRRSVVTPRTARGSVPRPSRTPTNKTGKMISPTRTPQLYYI